MNDKLKIFVAKYNNKLYLEDKTDYPLEIDGTSYFRDEFAIAINYSYNDFIINSFIDLSNDPALALKGGVGDITSMIFYLIPIYSGGTYGMDQVVFIDDLFFSSKIDNNTDVPEIGNNNWTVLTQDNAIDALKQNAILGYPIAEVDMYSDIPLMELFSIAKLVDSQYEIVNNTNGLYKVESMALYDYENNFIKTVSNIFDIEEDGVYKVIIKYGIMIAPGPDDPSDPKGGSIADQMAVLLITHVDNIECCYKRMIHSLYCEGSDYCLDKDCFQQREMEYNLNEISNIYSTLIMDMKVSRMKFYNIMPASAEKEKYVQEVGRLVKIIRLAVNECKDCCNE